MAEDSTATLMAADVEAALALIELDVDDANGDLTYTVEIKDGANVIETLSYTGSDISFTPPLNFFGTLTATVTVADSGGLSDETSFEIVVTPVNDAPTILAGQTVTQDINELNQAADDGNPEETAITTGGSFLVEDVDDASALTVSVLPDPEIELTPAGPGSSETIPDGLTAALAAMISVISFGAANAANDNARQIDFNFGVQDQAIDFLGDGDTLTITYQVRVTDGEGAFVDQPILIVINGSNDAPTVTSSLVEIIDEGEAAPLVVDLLDGADDLDLSDTLSVGDFLAMLPAGVSVTGSQLTFDATDPAYDHLAVGDLEEVTVNYTISDGNGGSVGQSLTITVNGTNDAPVVGDVEVGDPLNVDASGGTGSDASGNVYEDCGIHGQLPNIATGDVLVTGMSGNASDVDDGDEGLLAVVSVTSVSQSGMTAPVPVLSSVSSSINGLYGALVIMANGEYTYSLYDTATSNGDVLDGLAHDQTESDVFTFDVSDTHAGGTTTATLSFTVVGTNDSPMVGDIVGSVIEDNDTLGILSTIGMENITDVDLTDDHTASVNQGGNDGELTAVVNNTTGQLEWVYTINNGLDVVQELGVGQSFSETFTVTVDDGSGAINATTTTQVTITVNGTNDAPTLEALSVSGNDTDIAGGLSIDLLNQMNANDVDNGDVLTVEEISGILMLHINGLPSIDLSGLVELTELGSDGTFTIDPFVGNLIAELMEAGDEVTFDGTVTISDGNGGTATADLDFALAGTSENDTPDYGADEGMSEMVAAPDFLVPTFDSNGDEIIA